MTRAVEVPDLRLHFVRQWQPGGIFWSGTADRCSRAVEDDDRADLADRTLDTIATAEDSLQRGELFWVAPDFVPLLVHAARSLPPDFGQTAFVPAAPRGLLAFGRPIADWGPLDTDDCALSWATSAVGEGKERGYGVQSVAYAKIGSHWLDIRQATWMAGDGVEETRGVWRRKNTEDGASRVARDKRLFAAFSLLLGQRIALETTERMPRQVERRSERADLPSTVRVVRLREVIRPTPEADEDDLHRAVDWSHRWVVSGHWRNQPIGEGRAQRTLVWIAPYVKGPDGLPLVVKDTVKALVR